MTIYRKFIPVLATLILVTFSSRVSANEEAPAPDQLYKTVLTSGLWQDLSFDQENKKFLLNVKLDLTWFKADPGQGNNNNYSFQVKGKSSIFSYGITGIYSSLTVDNLPNSSYLNTLVGGLINFSVIPIPEIKVGIYSGIAFPVGKKSFAEDSYPLLNGFFFNSYQDFSLAKINLAIKLQETLKVDLFAETPFSKTTATKFNLLGRIQAGGSLGLSNSELIHGVRFSLLVPLEVGVVGYYDYAAKSRFYQFQGLIGAKLKVTAIDIFSFFLGYQYTHGKLSSSHHLKMQYLFEI